MRRFPSLQLLPLLLLGCGPAQTSQSDHESPSQTRTFVDDRGVEITLSGPPGRVVSLVPSFTTLILRLGAGETLVARTDFDTASALLSLPTVGTGLNPSLEAIAALAPDLVIGFAGPSDPGTPAGLRNLGIPFAAFDSDSVNDVLRVTDVLGELLGRTEQATGIVQGIRDELRALGERTASLDPVRTAVVIGGSPPWVAGPGSYMAELLELAGGINVFDDLGQPFSPVSPELFVARSIDRILLSPGAVPPPGAEGIPVGTLPDGIDIPGPDLARYALELAVLLHPEIRP